MDERDDRVRDPRDQARVAGRFERRRHELRAAIVRKLKEENQLDFAADQVIVTSDNPRSEEPQAILDQIVAGMDAAGAPHQAIEDRATAILAAVKQANKQDVILLAGKGHEPYQEIKGRKMPFSDADHAALALAARATMKRAH